MKSVHEVYSGIKSSWERMLVGFSELTPQFRSSAQCNCTVLLKLYFNTEFVSFLFLYPFLMSRGLLAATFEQHIDILFSPGFVEKSYKPHLFYFCYIYLPSSILNWYLKVF